MPDNASERNERGAEMSQACLKQIHYWMKALRESEKGHRRKNKHINRLERENLKLRQLIADLQVELAKQTLGS